jgi:hypothetical protein
LRSPPLPAAHRPPGFPGPIPPLKHNIDQSFLLGYRFSFGWHV